MSAPNIAAEGVTNPSIDDLLTKTDSKYKLVLYSAKRARQINAYYSQLGEGLLEYVGPLVETHVQEKPLSIALREINDDLLTCEDVDPAELAAEEAAAKAAAADAARRLRAPVPPRSQTTPCPAAVVLGVVRRHRGLQGLRAAPPVHRVRPRRDRRADRGRAAVRRRPHLGRAVRASPSPPRCGTTSTRCRTCRIGQSADLVVVAPATADLLAKAAHGLADDLLTNTLLTARCPVVFAPAMHTEMWEHPATRANVATLRERGALVLEPAEGRLTGADSGKGRLPEAAEIFDVCLDVLARGIAAHDLAGRQVVVSAGGTREYLDPVRFLGNRSQRAAGLRPRPRGRLPRRRGHAGRRQRRAARARPASRSSAVETTAQLRDEVLAAAASADAVVMAAAPADFRPTSVSDAKIKKADDGSAPSIELAQNPDILHELSTHRLAAGPGGRRLRRRDRRRDRLGARPGPRQARPQGLRPAGRQRRQRGSGVREPRQRGRHPGRGRRQPRRTARFEDRGGARHLGRSGLQTARLSLPNHWIRPT